MDNRTKSHIVAIISYFSWICWIIAMVIKDPGDYFAAHHLNQSLLIQLLYTLAAIVRIVPILGDIAASIIGIIAFVFWCIGIYRAIVWSDKPLPIIGDIHLVG